MDAAPAAWAQVYKLTKRNNRWYAVRNSRAACGTSTARRKFVRTMQTSCRRAFRRRRHRGGALPRLAFVRRTAFVEHEKKIADVVASIAMHVPGLEVCQQALFFPVFEAVKHHGGPDRFTFSILASVACLRRPKASLVDTMSTANSETSGLDVRVPSIMDPTLTPTGDQYSLGCILYYSDDQYVPGQRGSDGISSTTRSLDELRV